MHPGKEAIENALILAETMTARMVAGWRRSHTRRCVKYCGNTIGYKMKEDLRIQVLKSGRGEKEQ
jgi:hypothetical protein